MASQHPEQIFRDAIIGQLKSIEPKLEQFPVFELIGRSTKKEYDYVIQVAKVQKFWKIEKPENPNSIAAKWLPLLQKNELLLGFDLQGNLIFVQIDKNRLLQNVLRLVLSAQDKYGTSTEGNGKTVVIDYSSPNIAKPFHAGHLRSTIIGNFLANLHRALGYKVVGLNYLGDWGKQFGLLAVGFDKMGSEEELVKNPIKHLFDVYVKINAYADEHKEVHDEARQLFKRMEQGDEEALAIWRKFRGYSIEEYKKVYARLGVEFDVYSGESQQTTGMDEQCKILEEKGLLKDDNGAQIVDMKDEKLGVALVRKSDGATLYFTRDIAAAVQRYNDYKFDKMIYVVASAQNLHFQQLFRVLDKMGYEWAKNCSHINFGLVKGMSTRKGTVVFLDEILEEANKKMREIMEENKEKFAEIEDPDETADKIGLSAVFIQDMQAGRNKDYEFKWDRIFQSNGHTGPYLQYAYARLCALERKGGVEVNQQADMALLVEPEALELAAIIGRYNDILVACVANSEPSTLVSYLFELSHAVAVAHQVLWVKDRPKDIAEARLLLYHCAKITLGNGMRILGLQPLQRV